MSPRRFAVRSKTNAALLRGHERPCSSFAPRSFFSLCARQHRPARQVLIMIPVTEKLFEKEGEHAHDPVFFFCLPIRKPRAVFDVTILAQVAVKPIHVSGKRDCIIIKWFPRSIMRDVL
jgi:hypothetical protein